MSAYLQDAIIKFGDDIKELWLAVKKLQDIRLGYNWPVIALLSANLMVLCYIASLFERFFAGHSVITSVAELTR